MSKSCLKARLLEATVLLSLAAFLVCVGMAVHSTVMAKKARRAVDVLAQMQGKLTDLCLRNDMSSCAALQKSTHGYAHAGLSAWDYEARAEDYGVASAVIPFLLLMIFFADQWTMTGKVPWEEYAPTEQP